MMEYSELVGRRVLEIADVRSEVLDPVGEMAGRKHKSRIVAKGFCDYEGVVVTLEGGVLFFSITDTEEDAHHTWVEVE